MRLVGGIIAGGRGTRMGTPHKAALPLRDGSTGAQRVAAALIGAGCAPVLIGANDPAPYSRLGLRVVPDLRPGAGPLGGIEALLAAAAPDPVCFAAGDMPDLDAATLRRLIAGWDGRLAVARSTRMQPLCCVVAAGLLGEIRAALERGEHGVQRLWRRLGAAEIAFADEAPFADLDTPEDLAGHR